MTSKVVQSHASQYPPIPMSRSDSVSSTKSASSAKTLVEYVSGNEFASKNLCVLSEKGKVEGDVPLTFSEKELTHILGSLFDFLKKSIICVILYKLIKNAIAFQKNACLIQSKPRITYPTLPTVKVEPAQAELSIPDKQLGTEQLLEKVLEGLPKANNLLTEYKELLTSVVASKEEKTLCTAFKNYQLQLADLEKWFKCAESVKSDILLNIPEDFLSAHFMEEQVSELKIKVASLSDLNSVIKESMESENLFKAPSLDDIRFTHGLIVGLGYFASSSLLFVGGMAIPWIGFLAASASLVGLIGIWGYVQYRESQIEKWEKRIDIKEINQFTKQLESLKESAVSDIAITQGKTLVQHHIKIEQQETVIKSQEQEIEELKREKDDMRARLEKLEAILLSSSPPNISFEAPKFSSNANKKPNAAALG